MLKLEPYFMKNTEWYYHDKKKNRFFLTDKAPKEAIQSYKEYYDDDFDFSCQSVMTDIIMDSLQELLDAGIPESKAKEIIKYWQSEKCNKSFNELKDEALKK